MSILQECPNSECHRKQKIKNKKCVKCGLDLDKAKKAKKVKYWVSYRLPGGKQKRVSMGNSISDAKALDGKVKGQKREGRLFDVKNNKMTFNELTSWYLGLEKIKSKKYYPTIQFNLASFNSVFGDRVITTLKPALLEDYQEMRKKEGRADSYIDKHIGAARTMVNKGIDNDIIGGDAIKPFKRTDKLLQKNSNARDRVISQDEFNSILEHLPRHGKDILQTAYYTGMRRGEIMRLTWDKVDLKTRFINLEATDTKDKEKRSIPISDELHSVLTNIIRATHNNHVFIYRGRAVNDIRTGLIKACKKAGILYGRNVKGGFVFHDIRHSFVTNLRKAGIAESVIMAITGHSTREMFDRYNTVDKEDKRNAVDHPEVFFRKVDKTVDHEQKQAT